MRARPEMIFLLAPVVAYLVVLGLVAAFVVEPSTIGWIGLAVVAAIGLAVGSLAAALFSRTRANPRQRHPHRDHVFRLLVVADAYCEPEKLVGAVQQTLAGRPAAVRVTAPVLASPLKVLTDSEAGEQDDARVRLEDTLNALAGAGIEASGAVGDDDPLQAIGDALFAFPADELLVVSDPGRRRWLERNLERKARDAYGVHVRTLLTTTA